MIEMEENKPCKDCPIVDVKIPNDCLYCNKEDEKLTVDEINKRLGQGGISANEIPNEWWSLRAEYVRGLREGQNKGFIIGFILGIGLTIVFCVIIYLMVTYYSYP